MLSSELEICLNEAFQSAREARHEFMTVEHLLLAIVDTPKVREILRACGADVARLRKDLKDFIDQTTPRLKDDDDREVQPTLGFQRVLQRHGVDHRGQHPHVVGDLKMEISPLARETRQSVNVPPMSMQT